jgi:hypothetical protein
VDPFRICQIAAEATPFAKTGGLGDVVSGLSRFLHESGHDVRIFLPFYAQLRKGSWPFTPVDFIKDVPIQIGRQRYTYSAWSTTLPESDLAIYFLDCPQLFQKEGIYQGDYEDSVRFAFLALATFECCQRMGWAPDVVHCHDWHTALAPLYLRTLFGWDRLFDRTRTLLTFITWPTRGSSRRAGLTRPPGQAHRPTLTTGRPGGPTSSRPASSTPTPSRPSAAPSPRRSSGRREVLVSTLGSAPAATSSSASSTASTTALGTRPPTPTSRTTTRPKTWRARRR